MGRVPICRCGYVKLWHGVVYSSENSQHLTDWYVLARHPRHRGLRPSLAGGTPSPTEIRSADRRAAGSDVEVFENTPFVIERYRAATISLDYFGDSIVNSMSDIASMMIGFWMARKIPVWLSVTIVIVLEIAVGLIIRDNLTLNILMLIHPVEAIKRWQLGGA
jgi:hypothetical protein